MPVFAHDGLSFQYQDQGTGTPFVFQHGLGGDLNQPRGFFLPEPPFRLLTLETRGHGETKPFGDPAKISFSQSVEDVRDWLDWLGIERSVVGGISMGSGIALAFTLRYPERVDALVLSRPAWLSEPNPPNLRVHRRIAALIREYGEVEGKRRFLESADYADALAVSSQGAATLIGQFDRPRSEETVELLDRITADAPNRDAAEWATISVPTLVIGNQLDPVHPFDYAETLAKAIPGARLVEVTPRGVDDARHTTDVHVAIVSFFRKHGLLPF